MRWTVDVTLNDVEAIVDFLRQRMPDDGVAHTVQSYRTHYALSLVISAFRKHIREELSDEAIAHALENFSWEVDRAYKIKRYWNDLVGIARFWDEDEGYDSERWVRREVLDAEKDEEAPPPAADEEVAEFAVSEYRIPRARGGVGEDIVVARSAEHPDVWGVFEGNVQGWHWDGSSWQHRSLSGSSPYQYTEQDALDAARRCAAAPRRPEGTDR
ncbi:hypothetical protein [Streptomyces hydrogenans]|uniref:hypothetical protein n=1 Tax=Streptomyces hydrogenans TaxID=1873719 RepID=UPI0036DFF3C5